MLAPFYVRNRANHLTRCNPRLGVFFNANLLMKWYLLTLDFCTFAERHLSNQVVSAFSSSQIKSLIALAILFVLSTSVKHFSYWLNRHSIHSNESFIRLNEDFILTKTKANSGRFLYACSVCVCARSINSSLMNQSFIQCTKAENVESNFRYSTSFSFSALSFNVN